MQPLNKRWSVPSVIPPDISQELEIYPPVLRQILYNRGYDSAQSAAQFLQALPLPGTAPSDMLGVAESVDRLDFAISHQEPIAIYGDYDADGVTATALLVRFLQEAGANVRPYIPNRFDEGYGLNVDALTSLKKDGVKLVITVDCGIRSPVEADHARSIGLDLIITDHHQPAGVIPSALAVINPKQASDLYPDKNLAGVGLAYKLAQGLEQAWEKAPGSRSERLHAGDHLDLVAIGTVADMAPLVGENRVLVRAGLESIRQPHKQGLRSLIGASGLQPFNLTAGEISYMLGPRLNAAGRLDSALDALQLLLSNDVQESGRLAQRLNQQNTERQEITREMVARAEKIALDGGEVKLLLFAAQPDFNPGVVGLAASRLTEAYYRPAIVAHEGPEFTRASCRSIPEFHITAALDQCAELLEHHGGHAAAAGFTVKNENLGQLLERLQGIAQDQLAQLDLRPSLIADMELPLSELTPDLLGYLAWLQPTGLGNQQPLFISRGLRVTRFRAIGRDNAHLKLTVTDGDITYDAIAFRQGSWQEHMPAFVDLIYAFETNEYNGTVSLQLNVRDLKPSESSLQRSQQPVRRNGS